MRKTDGFGYEGNRLPSPPAPADFRTFAFAMCASRPSSFLKYSKQAHLKPVWTDALCLSPRH